MRGPKVMAPYPLPGTKCEPTVYLSDWWLVESDSKNGTKRLAIAGYNNRGDQAMRLFSSGPILKRYDVFTLLTTDGITVVIDGFMNKGLTLASGFPPEILNYFLFGFPPCWEEYYEKFMGKESPSRATSGVNRVREEKLRQSRSKPKDEMKSTGLDADSEKDKHELFTEIPSLDNNLRKDKSSETTSLRSRAANGNTSSLSEKVKVSEKKTRSKLDTSGAFIACKKRMRQSQSKPIDRRKSITLDADSEKNECPVISEMPNQGKDKSKGNMPKAKNRATPSVGTPAVADEGSLSEKVKASGMKKRRKSDTSGVNLVREKRLRQSQSKSIDKMKSTGLDADFEKDKIELISKMPGLVNDPRKVKRKGSTQKAANRATSSLSTPDVNADKSSLSDKVKALGMRTRRKLAYETPEREKEKASVASPESLSLKRSRSGRLLMPTLAFWRNQTAVFDMDRTVTGIKKDENLEQTRKGSRSMPERKRR